MRGTVGDMVPSIKGATGEKHFVSPKKSDEIPDLYVKLTVEGISETLFQKLYVWSGDGEEVAGQPLKRQVKRDATGDGPFVVTIKDKASGKIADKMNVWIVWATGAPALNPAPEFNQSGYVCRYERKEASPISFKFTIAPHKLIEGLDDFPDLTGTKTADVPGKDNPHYSDPKKWGDGVTLKWDVTRQANITMNNPASIQPKDFADWYFPPRPRYLSHNPFNGILEPWPDDKLAGNDDSFRHRGDEDDDPYKKPTYTDLPRKPLEHEIGEVTSVDSPLLPSPMAKNLLSHPPSHLARDTEFGWKFEFREFVRLQIGSKWYCVSNKIPWSMEFKAKVKDNVHTVGDSWIKIETHYSP